MQNRTSPRLLWLVLLLALTAACSTEQRDSTRTQVAAAGVGLHGERFNVEISGDYEKVVTPGFSLFYFAQDIGAMQLILHDGAQSIWRIIFLVPPGLGPGTHELTPSVVRPELLQGVTVTVAGPRDVANFSIDVTGTLTLDSFGEQASGSFAFTARNLDGKTITVTGSFTDVPRTD